MKILAIMIVCSAIGKFIGRQIGEIIISALKGKYGEDWFEKCKKWWQLEWF